MRSRKHAWQTIADRSGSRFKAEPPEPHPTEETRPRALARAAAPGSALGATPGDLVLTLTKPDYVIRGVRVSFS